MSKRSKKPPAQQSELARLAHLGANEARHTLLTFAARHPEFVAEIRAIVREHAEVANFADVADRVFAALAGLSMYDVRTHTDEHPFGRHVVDAVHDLVAATLQPFVTTIEQYSQMGMAEAAGMHCQGLLLGLYRAERDPPASFDELGGPVETREYTGLALEAFAPLRGHRLGATSLTAAQALRAFAVLHLREWTWLYTEK